MPSTLVSIHADGRINERLSLSTKEIIEILDNNFAVNLKTERFTHKVHWLFYSIVDKCCFVAVRCGITKTIITVKPVSCGKLSPKHTLRRKARFLIDENYRWDTHEIEEYSDEYKNSPNYVDYNKIKDFELFAVCSPSQSPSHSTMYKFGWFEKDTYGHDIPSMRGNIFLHNEIMKFIVAKDIDVDKFVKFSVRLNAYDSDFERVTWRVSKQYFTNGGSE